MAKQCCCGIMQNIHCFDLTTSGPYVSRNIKYFNCKVCNMTWLFKEFTKRNGESLYENITKRKPAQEEFNKLKSEIILPLIFKRKRYKVIFSRELRYLEGKDGTIRNLKTNKIYEKFESETRIYKLQED